MTKPGHGRARWFGGRKDFAFRRLRSPAPVCRFWLAGLFALGLSLAGACARQPERDSLLLVANLQSSDVSVVDLAGGSEIRRIPVAANPHEFLPVDGRVLVSNYRSEMVTVVTANDAAGSTPVPGEPHGLAMAGSTVAVTRGRAGAVALLNAGDLSVRATVWTGGEPHMAAATAGMIYVVDAAGGQLVELDPRAAVVTRRLPVGTLPESLAISPDGRLIVVANARSADLVVIDRATWREQRRAALNGAPVRVAFAPDGRTVAASLNDQDAVALVDVTTGAVISTIPVGERPDGLAFTPDGRRLFVALTGAGQVAVVEMRSRRLERTLLVGDGPSGLLLLPRN